ncbi:MAG: ATP-dependent Clp protease ATP-binding subunit, partial [Prevotella sp.]|nr:ATP-dependent Clp protease ATP-binding subunit [Prevotella sp.]
MTSQFSPKVSEILAFSREEATRLASQSVGPEHLLLGILRGRNASVMDIFSRMDINLQSVKLQLENRVREGELNQPIYTRDLVLNEKANNILKLAVLEARIQRTQLVDVEHLLLAILHDQVNNGAKEVLELNNMNYEDTITYLRAGNTPAQRPTSGLGIPDEDEEDEENATANYGAGKSAGSSHAATVTTTRNQKESKTPVLDNFSTDLTQAAVEGKLDPVVGREREIQRVIEILCRRKKNNPILIGEPG